MNICCHYANIRIQNRETTESGIAVGDIVIVRNEKSNRNFWKLAKAKELQSGDDGVVRAATIRIF
jgi:SOS-response transcriptional repressor LexA